MGKHLTKEQRYQIEAYLKLNTPVSQIAALIGCSRRTVYRELDRGRCELLDSHYRTYTAYSPDLADNRVKQNKQRIGRKIKLHNCVGLAELLAYYIGKQHYSPETALFEIQQMGLNLPLVSVTSVYRYVRRRLLDITISDLPVGRYRIKQVVKQDLYKSQKHLNDRSIEDRPACVADRQEFGHIEIDTVLGSRESGKCLLVLTERKTRFEIICLLGKKAAAEVVSALGRLRNNMIDWVKTLTCDNGAEFANAAGMELLAPTYYCHPYSAWERGSNELQNKYIRRFCPKGRTMQHLTEQDVQQIMDWMNYYPRKSLGWQRPADLFYAELHKLGIENFPF